MTDIRTLPNDLLFADLERLFAEGGDVQLPVKGYSMRPFLMSGRDSVHLVPAAPERLRRGMVILFRYRTGHVLHRIRHIEGERLTIVGDGNYRQQERVTRADVIACVDSILRNGRTIRYGTCRWHLLSAYSLALHLARTLYHDLRGDVKRNNR